MRIENITVADSVHNGNGFRQIVPLEDGTPFSRGSFDAA